MSIGNVVVSQDAPAKNNLWIQPKGTARFWNGSIWKTITDGGGSGDYLTRETADGLYQSLSGMSSYLTKTEALNTYLTIEFFEHLFELHSGASGNPKINANSTITGDTSNYNIKAMFGFWTEQYITALGQTSSSGGGGGGFDWDMLITYDGDTTHVINSSYLPNAYLPLSGGTLTGTLQVNNIEATNGNGLLCYHPTSWTAVSSTQWGLGATDSQGVIRSNNSNLIHYKGGTNYTILDTSNSATVNFGTTNYLAYYSSANTISSTVNLVVSGKTINLPQINSVALNFRPNDENYSGWIAYETGGNEAMVFGAKNTNTSFIFANTTNEANVSNTQWQSLTPALQIKQNCVYINSLIGQNVTPSYNLYVNGTSYLNGTVGIGDTSQNTQGLTLKSAQAQLRFISYSDGKNYIESGNASWNASANLNISGYNDGIINSLTLRAVSTYISGNVGIGTSSPPVKLSVDGDIYASGSITALQTVTSDKRFKKNIKKFEAKEIIEKLQPVEFEWNSKAKKYSDTFKDGKNYGLLAQDSDGIIDDLVFDLPDGKGYKGVRYEKLIPILLQAIKEQNEKIENLEYEINVLKGVYK